MTENLHTIKVKNDASACSRVLLSMSTWFQGDCVQEKLPCLGWTSMLSGTVQMLHLFFPKCHPVSAKDMLLFTDLTFSLGHLNKHIACPFFFFDLRGLPFYLAIWAPFAF
jgi:hypothetical protein